MMRLFDLKDVVGKTGYIKLTWSDRGGWSLFALTSEEKTWAGNHLELEALCLHCLDALDPEWSGGGTGRRTGRGKRGEGKS